MDRKKKGKKKGGLSPTYKPRFAGLSHPLAARLLRRRAER
jgi:hypothetical protein